MSLAPDAANIGGMRLLALLALALAAVPARAAGDSDVVEALVERVEFEETFDPEGLPPIFPWDEANRERVRGVVRRALQAMPLDAGEFGHMKKLVISNMNAACGTAVREYYHELVARGDSQMAKGESGSCADPGGWKDTTGELMLSGKTTLDTRAAEIVLVHELAHAWHTGHAARLKPFFELRYRKLSKLWARLQSQHHDWQRERGFKTEDAAAAEELERVEYETYRMPSRGKDSPRGRFDQDRHAMNNELEYFAVLVEMLHNEPERAAAQYSSEEIDWVRRRVLGGAVRQARARGAAALGGIIIP